MALVAHRMMLPSRHRRTTQQVARNKVGVLLVPSVADYYSGDVVPPAATPLPTPAVSQLNLHPDPAEAAVDGSGSGKVSATSRCNVPDSVCRSVENGKWKTGIPIGW
ncbi:uncharacterized protein LOC110185118 [Drosophila serrata]|uniref:uncharacterized protein LOC110185118 n=1 Tax=Drosophila serrata TaxID=7274 RepID=UPI000A1D26F7|nr:uncharacterized protein LOC110185118 [Drosophila serrata]